MSKLFSFKFIHSRDLALNPGVQKYFWYGQI